MLFFCGVKSIELAYRLGPEGCFDRTSPVLQSNLWGGVNVTFWFVEGEKLYCKYCLFLKLCLVGTASFYRGFICS